MSLTSYVLSPQLQMCTNVISILIKLSNIIFKCYPLGDAAFTMLARDCISLFSSANCSSWFVYGKSLNKLGEEDIKCYCGELA
jgi:hypothetical protein